MGRKVLAVVVAMIAGVAIIFVGWMISKMFGFTTPKNLEYATAQDISNYARSLPASAYISGLVTYVVAAFAGGFIATKIGRRWSPGMSLAVIVGILLTGFALLGSLSWPQPVWFIIAEIVLFVPISIFGYRLADHAFSAPRKPVA
jgi:MFS family permease